MPEHDLPWQAEAAQRGRGASPETLPNPIQRTDTQTGPEVVSIDSITEALLHGFRRFPQLFGGHF